MFNILVVRTAEQDDGTMYPVIGDETWPIELEPLDGPRPQTLVATGLSVSVVDGGALKRVVTVKDIKADVLLTDARVAVACEKYTKGGGWVGIGGGAAVVALGLNAVSKARAAHRRQGKILVGQVRYPWLKSVGCEAKTGFTSVEAIRLSIVEAVGAEKRQVVLTATLPKNVSAAAVAQAIVQRAARYRLAYTNLEGTQRARTEQLSQAPMLVAEPKKFVFYDLPSYFYASRTTAYPKASAVDKTPGEPGAGSLLPGQGQ